MKTALVIFLVLTPTAWAQDSDIKQLVDALTKMNQKIDRIDSKFSGLGSRITALESKAYTPYQSASPSYDNYEKTPKVPAHFASSSSGQNPYSAYYSNLPKQQNAIYQ